MRCHGSGQGRPVSYAVALVHVCVKQKGVKVLEQEACVGCKHINVVEDPREVRLDVLEALQDAIEVGLN